MEACRGFSSLMARCGCFMFALPAAGLHERKGEQHPSESAARPSAKSPHVARREAPAVVRKDRGAIGLRFSARHPFGPLRGFRWGPANPGCVARIAATMEHVCMAVTAQHTPRSPLVGEHARHPARGEGSAANTRSVEAASKQRFTPHPSRLPTRSRSFASAKAGHATCAATRARSRRKALSHKGRGEVAAGRSEKVSLHDGDGDQHE
jgi:hypothetical protein